MLEATDTPIPPILKLFSIRGVEVSFLVPTATGMEKSILDAISTVRVHLKSKRIHNFATQGQGQDHKRIVRAFFVDSSKTTETEASLYRPLTKQGDPRIWFYGLKQFANARNLLGLLVYKGAIYVFNASDKNTIRSLNDPKSPLYQLVEKITSKEYSAATELLKRLTAISDKGFLKSIHSGDTAVGAMLLHELEIEVYDTRKGPDFQGIEIKAHRLNTKTGKHSNRDTLFGQVPDWARSKLKSGAEILRNYGYDRRGRKQLYCTVSTLRPNSQGLFLKVNQADGWLDNLANDPDGSINEVVKWELGKLRSRLLEKHPETFFVGAKVEKRRGKEFFHYVNADHTRGPLVTNFDLLLDQGIVTFDYTISQRGATARDHGYLFKIHPKHIELLLPKVNHYNLQRPRHGLKR